MQVWLVAMAALAFWRADVARDRDDPGFSAVLILAGYGLVAVSVIITIRAGGTVG